MAKDKEVALVPAEMKQEVSLAQQQANALIVSTPDEAEAGATLLGKIKEAKKNLTARKEEITRPLMKSLASARDLFKPHETNLVDAETIVKSKILAYSIESTAQATKERERIEGRVERGTMKAETAAAKLGELADTPKIRGIQTRTLTKVRVIDETAIPREYLLPDMVKITEAILRQGAEVPGVEKYEDKVIAGV